MIDAYQDDEEINKQSEMMRSNPELGTSKNPEAENIRKISTGIMNINKSIECSRCGRKGHDSYSSFCTAKNQKCNKCTRIGHFAIKCRTNLKRERPQGHNEISKRQRTKVRRVEGERDLKSGESCFKIQSDEEDEFIKCRIGGREVSLVIDSGSKFNLISPKDWSYLQTGKVVLFNVRPNSNNKFRGYASHELLHVICVFEAPISIGLNPEVMASFFVIKNGTQSLLRKDTALELNVLRLGLKVKKIDSVTPFPKWKGPPVKLSIDTNIKPIQQPIRRIPIALEDKVIAKLEEAVALDIIEPVIGHSPCISPMVIAFKENGDLRICIDMRLANKAILRENYPLPVFESFMTKLRGAQYFTRLDPHIINWR